jgi:putative hydrolase of the HAD superfamily
MIKVIGFDLDDTLWDVAPVIHRAEAKLDAWLTANAPGLKYSVATMRALRKKVLDDNPNLIGQITEFRRCIIERALRLSHVPVPQSIDLSHQAIEVFLQARNQVELFDGAEEVLKLLANNYTLGALSNGNADIHRLGLAHVFSFGFSAEEVGAPKPEPHLLSAAMQHTNVTASEMIYVGDDPKLDVDAAKSLGLYTIWMDRGRRQPGEYKPDATITDIRQLPDAVASIDTKKCEKKHP